MMSNKNTNKSIRKNYFYNLLYQIVALLTPLLVTPYISRVLGSSGVGQYSFSFSIVTYFVLFANLGFTYYAQREIAKHQGDTFLQSKVFWEIIILKCFTSIFSISLFFSILFKDLFENTYFLLLEILSIEIIAVAFDVTFFFQGNEQFKTIAIRNVIIKCLGTALVFVLVKKQNDVWIFTLIQALMILVSNVLLWPKLAKCLTRVPLKELNVRQHFWPSVRLFAPTIAISVYTMLDKTLIGVFVKGYSENGLKNSDVENGYYELTEQIVKICLTIITSLGAVMIPRNSQTLADGDFERFKINIYNVLRFVFFIGAPIVVGIIAVSRNFCPWYFGSDAKNYSYLMMIFSPLVLIIGISNVLGLQFLIPLNKDRQYTVSIVSGAVLNLTLNLFLIPLLWSYGAAIATVIAELLISFLMALFAKKIIDFRIVLRSFVKPFVGSVVMFSVVFTTSFFLKSSIINTILLVIEGIFVYFSLLFLLRDKTIIDFKDSVLSIFRRKK